MGLKMTNAVMPVNGLLRGSEGETRHVCWECPVCGNGYSDDYDSDLTNPYPEQCGNSKRHPTGAPIRVSVAWRIVTAFLS